MSDIHPRSFLRLVVVLALVQIAGYWFSGAMVNGEGPLAIPQPDTAQYLQSAVRVAEGHPFSFSEGTAPSTGATSVLHQFVFSVPALLGVRDFSLVGFFFWINAVLYLVFILSWCAVVRKVVRDVPTRRCACLMLVFFPQPAYAALALSDIGLLLAYSGCLAAALVHDRRWVYGPLLILGPWIRPEGMILVLSFAFLTGASALFDRKAFRASDAFWAFAGVVSLLGVFALNGALTGACQFSSVAHKGYFHDYPFAEALSRSADDLLAILRAVCLGQSSTFPRHFYLIPALGGLMFCLGAFVHDWKGSSVWRSGVLPLAMAGSVWTVASSGWQNTNVDRYLAWIMPLVVICMTEGYACVARHVSSPRVSRFILSLPMLFAIGSSVVFWCVYNSAANQSDLVMKFGRELDRTLPKDASVGLSYDTGMAFPLRPRRVVHLGGIYSPEFKTNLLPENFETLKNRPETRFSHWLYIRKDGYGEELETTLTNVVAVGPENMIVARADWSLFDRAAAVPTNGVQGLRLVFRVDVGDPDDERISRYEIVPRYGMRTAYAFSKIAGLASGPAVDSGRVVWGFDDMFVPLAPGRDALVVMRTLRAATVLTRQWLHPNAPVDFDFGERQKLAVNIDARKACEAEYDVPADGFADVLFRIPGSTIVNPVSRVGFMGDHIACGYWFFQ